MKSIEQVVIQKMFEPLSMSDQHHLAKILPELLDQFAIITLCSAYSDGLCKNYFYSGGKLRL